MTVRISWLGRGTLSPSRGTGGGSQVAPRSMLHAVPAGSDSQQPPNDQMHDPMHEQIRVRPPPAHGLGPRSVHDLGQAEGGHAVTYVCRV